MYNAKIKSGYRQFIEDEKNGLSNLIIITGAESYLSKWAVKRIVDNYTNSATRIMDLTELDEETYSFIELEQAMESLGMMGGQRVIVLRLMEGKALKSDEDKIHSLLKKSSDSSNDNILIIYMVNNDKFPMATKTKNLFRIYDFNKLERGELYKFIHNQLKIRKKNMKDEDINHLIDVSGYLKKESNYTLINLINDMDKIIAITDEDGSEGSSREIIENVVLGFQESYIFSLIDAMLKRHKGRALEIFNNIYSSEKNAMNIIGLIVSTFEISLSLKQLKKDRITVYEAAKILSINSYRAEKISKSTANMNEENIKKSLILAYRIEQNIKAGIFDERTAVEYFISEI
ncbi:DNA polymerase III subunit delta [Eubacteriales bacterium KG127]